ncbi:MAG: hypothetical protein HYZ14_01855 [Bacteroidetes bacterium]|nr:hypothetical protein [Bacteroidota bacterium]
MKTGILILSLLCATALRAQTNKFVETYKRESGFFKTLTIPMSFDSDSIDREKPAVDIGQVYRIDYVATLLDDSVTAYQRRLDSKRWSELYRFTGINSKGSFEKNTFYQTTAANEEDARLLFHGFVVYYEESASKLHERALGDIPEFFKTLAGKEITEELKTLTLDKPKCLDTVSVGNITADKMSEIEKKYMKESTLVDWHYDSVGVNKIFYNTRYYLTKVSAGIFACYSLLGDKSVLQMFRRLNSDKNTLIVTDLTGSMYPYYSQLMLWHTLRLNQNKTEHYVFFNDGDSKETHEKVIGSTGGLYPVKTNQVLDVYRSMATCMAKGGGGDCPENNFEAVLYGLEQYDSIQKIILICDNWAVPRDTALLKKIRIPIDFVVCGASLGVNPAYLNLAKQNKGKIHTMEKSLVDLDKKKEGDKFLVGSKKFTVHNGAICEDH